MSDDLTGGHDADHDADRDGPRLTALTAVWDQLREAIRDRDAETAGAIVIALHDRDPEAARALLDRLTVQGLQALTGLRPPPLDSDPDSAG